MALLARFSEDSVEAGCDEAGRGCLSGPVVAAAVILPDDFDHPLLNDSKKLTKAQRQSLRPIIEAAALAYCVKFVNEQVIDDINILNASFQAMHLAIDGLQVRPELLLIDGNRFPAYLGIPHHTIVKGDGKYQSIAAASILAKTYRDSYMEDIAKKFPQYNWQQNKGYGTLEHRTLLAKHGPCIHHRKSFKVKSLTEKEASTEKILPIK